MGTSSGSDRIKTRLWAALRTCGVKRAMDGIWRIEPIVLMYHRFCDRPTRGRVSREELRAQLSFLRSRCNVISLEDLYRGLREGVSWKSSTVVVTVDDGYQDAYEFGFPAFREFGIPASLFVVSDFVSGRMWHWPDKVQYILSNTSGNSIEIENATRSSRVFVNNEEARNYAWNYICDRYFTQPERVRVEMIAALAKSAGVKVPEEPPAAMRPVTWPALREMVASGIHIGSHSVSHRRFSSMSAADAVIELRESKCVLEQKLQVPIDTFAYPYGAPQDQPKDVGVLVQNAGYKMACVAYFDHQLVDDLYAIRRFGAGPDYWDFIRAADGLKRISAVIKSQVKS